MAEIEISLDDERIPSAACLVAQLVDDDDQTIGRDLKVGQRRKKTKKRWSRKTIETTKAWARNAVTLKFYHIRAAQYYAKVAKLLTAPIAFMTAAIGTGVVAIAANGDTSSTVANVFLWIIAGLSYAVVGLSAANSEIDPATLSERHLHKAICWNSIYDDLVVELSLPKRKKHAADHFLSTVRTNMAYAERFPPVLPEWIYKTSADDVMFQPMHRELEVFNRRFGYAAVRSETGYSGDQTETQPKVDDRVPEDADDTLSTKYTRRFRELIRLQRFRDINFPNLPKT